MSADGEAEKVAVEHPPAAEEVAKPAEKPVKEKKTKAPREKKPKTAKTVSHPPYFQMITEALLALNEKGGSSPYAIAKYMEEKHKAVLPENFRKIMGLQLKNSAARGKLIKIKASYKLSEVVKKEKVTTKPTAKKPKQTKSATDTGGALKAKATKKSETVKKAAKKVAPKKSKKSTAAKPKLPKSIKSPAAKKAKKATA